MQVRTGGQSRGADVADDLPLLHGRAAADILGEALHVRVEGPVARAVLDHHGVAIATLGAGQNDLAVTRRLDGRAARRGVVHTLVGADLVQDGMLAAFRKARADPREVDGGADEGLAHVVAVGSVVAAFTPAGGVANRRIGRAAIDEAGGQDCTAADDLSVEGLLLIEHVELIAFANIHGEVDVVAEHVGQIHDQAVAQPGLIGGIKQRAGDGRVGIGLTHFRVCQHALELVAGIGLLDLDGFQLGQRRTQPLQLAIRRKMKIEFLAFPKSAQLAGFLAAAQHFMQQAGGQAHLAEYGGKGVTATHRDAHLPGHFRVG